MRVCLNWDTYCEKDKEPNLLFSSALPDHEFAALGCLQPALNASGTDGGFACFDASVSPDLCRLHTDITLQLGVVTGHS